MDVTLNRRQALVLVGAAATLSAHAAGADLRIGYQKSSVNLMVVRERKLLESRLPGVATKWVEFPAGPQILEALAVGSLDFGFTGDTPPVFAQAAGKDIWYAGLEPPKPASSAILVPSDSRIRTLADLKGRRVGFQKGSSAHFLVVRAVQKGGLQWSDITPVTLTPSDARAAFERGALDAWGIWDPYYAAAEIDGRARVLSTGVGLTSNNSYYLASRALTRDARTLKALFDSLSEADAWVKSNRSETAHFLAVESGLPLSTTIRFLERRTAGPVTRLKDADIADQQRVADTFAQLGLIPHPVRVADAVLKA
ncbi:aliphatic sulfonate ABC transporter substrate-binding protein [Scleromatobacter humisilvae]|uniref:Putative aliphatic sulfonates-binding protein n=1 Tax=Scleromatobacter humisilvae TaxID=2897159 RepID=A0A9X1YFP7_9BURK|nr:aliphatic sulfonate ABC transporter substrate-binding protein [Scleromatobacter humisilvae]MCK9684822.1 aliphatic sulfonate ABC transporter substrate-binding protein [Scleromatobacter humisilvae]